jgi:putative ABC transport system substrate-binding protein
MKKNFYFKSVALALVFILGGLLVACGDEADPGINSPAPVTTPVPGTDTGGNPTVAANAVTKLDWFELRPAAAANWTLTPDPQDKFHLTLTAKDPSRFEGSEKKIMMLYTKAGYSFDDSVNTLVGMFLEKKVRSVFTIVNVNYNPSVAGSGELGKAALKYAVDNKFDLIFAMGSDATSFVYDNFRGGPLPVVSVLSKDPVLLGQVKDYQSGSGTNIAYTSVGVPIDLQVTYFLELKPELKNISIMYEKTNRSAIETQVEPLRKYATERHITVSDVVVNDPKQAPQELTVKVPEAVAKLKESDPDLQNSIFLITGSTSVITAIDTINKWSDKVPVISVYPELVQEGDSSAVLSIGVSWDTATHLAGLYALDILAGRARAGDLKVGVITPPDLAINFKKARQVGLKIPFSFFESANFVYDSDGKVVRKAGQTVNR